MRIIDFDARTEPLEAVEQGQVYSHKTFVEPRQHAVKVIAPGMEVQMVAPTRGEALVVLADVFHELAFELRRMAFEQEGAVRIHEPKERR